MHSILEKSLGKNFFCMFSEALVSLKHQISSQTKNTVWVENDFLFLSLKSLLNALDFVYKVI